MDEYEQTPEETIEQAARRAAIDAVAEDMSPPGCVTLSNGIVLKIKSVPPLLIRRALMQLRKPEPPTVFLEEKGRDEPNPNDPRYLDALDQWIEAQNTAALNVMLLCGTAVESVPDDVPAHTSDDWIEKLAALDITVNVSNQAARYLTWLQTVACESSEDLQLLGSAVGRSSGLMEGDVNRAVDSFRGGPVRGTTDEPDISEIDIDRGEPSPAYSGNGSGV